MKLHPELTPELSEWALKQPVFFIATAPLHGRHVNLSPKGYPAATLSILSPKQVAYLDHTGSGCETASHLYENGRATLMFMSFGPRPRILRLFCRGRVIERDEALGDGHDDIESSAADGTEQKVKKISAPSTEYTKWLHATGKAHLPGFRAIYILDIFSVTTSCGWSVPKVLATDTQLERRPGAEEDLELAFFAQRSTLRDSNAYSEKTDKLRAYRVQENRRSLDGVPGLRTARREGGEWLWVGDGRAWMGRVVAEREGVVFGFVMGLLVAGLVWVVSVVMAGESLGEVWREVGGKF